MTSSGASTLFSRILLVLGGLLVIGLSYWFIQTSLAPVPVPPAPPGRGAVQFDPKLDVSKNTVFFNLRAMGPDVPIPSAIGRPNPFAPVQPPVTTVVASSTAASTLFVTSTPAATTTTP